MTDCSAGPGAQRGQQQQRGSRESSVWGQNIFRVGDVWKSGKINKDHFDEFHYVSVKPKWTWPAKFKTLTMKTRRQMFASSNWGQCVVSIFRLKVMVLFKNKESSLWDHFYWQKHLKLETSCSLPQQEAKFSQVYVYTYIHIHILVYMLPDTQSFSSHFNFCFVTISPFKPSATYYTAFQHSNV